MAERKGLRSNRMFPRHHRGWWRSSASQLQPQGGTRAWGPARRIHLGVVPEMFQPLPVRLDHALNADTVRLGDSGVGALQEVELLTYRYITQLVLRWGRGATGQGDARWKSKKMGFEGSRQESQPQPGPSRPPPSSLPVPPAFPSPEQTMTGKVFILEVTDR